MLSIANHKPFLSGQYNTIDYIILEAGQFQSFN